MSAPQHILTFDVDRADFAADCRRVADGQGEVRRVKTQPPKTGTVECPACAWERIEAVHAVAHECDVEESPPRPRTLADVVRGMWGW